MLPWGPSWDQEAFFQPPAQVWPLEGSSRPGRCLSLGESVLVSLSGQQARAVSPPVGSKHTTGQGGSPGALGNDSPALPPTSRAGSAGRSAPYAHRVHPEHSDPAGNSTDFFLLTSSNSQAFSPPANFRSPAILWEENSVKIKHSIQK